MTRTPIPSAPALKDKQETPEFCHWSMNGYTTIRTPKAQVMWQGTTVEELTEQAATLRAVIERKQRRLAELERVLAGGSVCHPAALRY